MFSSPPSENQPRTARGEYLLRDEKIRFRKPPLFARGSLLHD